MWLASFLIVVIIVGAYVLPTAIAAKRKHPSVTAIFMLNLLFGWTAIGWAIALIWALKKYPNQNTL